MVLGVDAEHGNASRRERSILCALQFRRGGGSLDALELLLDRATIETTQRYARLVR